jgi:ATP citrate (pro-S)-lyase
MYLIYLIKHLFLIIVYKRMEDAMLKHQNADVLVNFASLRSAYDSTIETLNYPQVRLKHI